MRMALTIRSSLREHGPSDIFAYHLAEDIDDLEVRSMSTLVDMDAADSLLYHSSFGIPAITKVVMEWPGQVFLSYHNITPHHFYERFDEAFASGLSWGRSELEMIRHRIVRAFADSEFNAAELVALGYSGVRVSALGANPCRLSELPTDEDLVQHLNLRFPEGFLLVVSQVLPHKRIEHAIETVHLLRTLHQRSVGLVVVGPHRNSRYMAELIRHKSTMPNVDILFTGEITDEQLATYYRTCLCLVSLSEHEGLSLPPLEAMAEGACVVARAAGAIPETLGSGGVLLPVDASSAVVAALVDVLLADTQTLDSLRKAGEQRVNDIVNGSSQADISLLIESVRK